MSGRGWICVITSCVLRCLEDGGLLTVGGFEPQLVSREEDGVSPWNPLTQSAAVASPLSSSTRSETVKLEELNSQDASTQDALEEEANATESNKSDLESESELLIAWTGLSSRAAYRVRVKRMRAAGVELGNGEEIFGKTLVDSGERQTDRQTDGTLHRHFFVSSAFSFSKRRLSSRRLLVECASPRNHLFILSPSCLSSVARCHCSLLYGSSFLSTRKRRPTLLESPQCRFPPERASVH